ncbi:hypothetical protein NDU88_008426 [Pleurodeles waltl]|uniref:Uncharacterized protein n=1 Tax=Pleurodeles waltl TaxID=8319 RepID=A0AAV7PWL7_PLEWA|nr:hypothetical protein NDU88_008426 [Pleurodeles waltl]
MRRVSGAFSPVFWLPLPAGDRRALLPTTGTAKHESASPSSQSVCHRLLECEDPVAAPPTASLTEVFGQRLPCCWGQTTLAQDIKVVPRPLSGLEVLNWRTTAAAFPGHVLSAGSLLFLVSGRHVTAVNTRPCGSGGESCSSFSEGCEPLVPGSLPERAALF